MLLNDPLSNFFTAIERDPRIRITHIGVFAALLKFWQQQSFRTPMEAFSGDIIRIAKLSSATTYHKCIKDLSDFGYISYTPSYKRNRGSLIYFNCVQPPG